MITGSEDSKCVFWFSKQTWEYDSPEESMLLPSVHGSTESNMSQSKIWSQIVLVMYTFLYTLYFYFGLLLWGKQQISNELRASVTLSACATVSPSPAIHCSPFH